MPRLSTVPDDAGLEVSRRGRLFRRLFTLFVVALLACSLAGFLGVRTTTKTASGGGYRLELRYARIARPGVAVPWELTITKPGGFGDKPVEVRTSSDYLDVFDENGLDPDPSSATQDDRDMIWQFDPPPGDTLTVSFDWRIEPGVQLKQVKGDTSVLEHGRKVATVRYRTWITP